MDVEGSSMIKSITWRSQVLKVTFQTGVTYHYCLVPRAVYQSFVASESKGKFFNQHIKHQYAYRKVE